MERRIAATNAKTGVARSAYFPSLTLSAHGVFQSSVYADLLGLPSSYWAVGPTLAIYLFGGGKRRAQVELAKAPTSEVGERYGGVVLASFRQVADDLSLLDKLGTAAAQQEDAAQPSISLAILRSRATSAARSAIWSALNNSFCRSLGSCCWHGDNGTVEQGDENEGVKKPQLPEDHPQVMAGAA